MSPRTNEENERIRKESKAKIIAAALDLFANQGYHTTSISMVAKQAGISKGLTYNYFSSKEELLNEVIQSVFQEGMDMGEAVMNPKEDIAPKQMLQLMINQYFDMLIQDKEKWQLTLSLTMQVKNIPSIHAMLKSIYDVMLQQLESIFAINGYDNPASEAKLLGAFFDGIAIQYTLFEDDYDFEGMKQLLEQKYLKD